MFWGDKRVIMGISGHLDQALLKDVGEYISILYMNCIKNFTNPFDGNLILIRNGLISFILNYYIYIYIYKIRRRKRRRGSGRPEVSSGGSNGEQQMGTLFESLPDASMTQKQEKQDGMWRSGSSGIFSRLRGGR